VLAVSGGCGTIEPPAVYPIIAHAGIPYLFPDAAFAGLVHPVHHFYFGVVPPYADQVGALARYAVNKLGKGSLGAFFTELPGVNGEVSAAKHAAQGRGDHWDGAQIVSATEPDLTPYALKMKQLDPKYLVVLGAGAEVLQYVEALKSVGWYPKGGILAGSANANGAFLTPASPYIQGKLMGLSPVALSGAGVNDCSKAFRAASPPVTAGGESLAGCGLAQSLITALTEVSPHFTTNNLIKAIQHWNDKSAASALPPLSFSAKNHLGEHEMWLVQAHGATWQDLTTIPIA
jgi:ABC-type branched-subunit amino acid transport system substrate-binding protein